MIRLCTILAGACLMIGCTAVPLKSEAQRIELRTEAPSDDCRFVGEAVGSQGNWFTGDWTANENLMTGARNELRNKAYAMGGNYVWLQNTSNTNAWGSSGTTNTTVVGNVYSCP